MIGKECNGLYLLLNSTKEYLRTNAVNFSTQRTSSFSAADISLWYKRLGHTTSKTLTTMLQLEQNSVEDIIRKYDRYPCAKQYRQPFYSSTSLTTDSFNLIHMDV